MDIGIVDPSLRHVVAKAPRFNLEKPFQRWLISTLSRSAPGKMTEGVERRIERLGTAKVRVHVPASTSGAALLWIHGGGLVLGSAALDDVMCAQTALQTGAVVIAVDYRLAPRHRYPAALDDCAAAFAWIVARASELGVDPARIAVGGQSAGGGLAAALVQRLHDEGTPVAAQWLFCPMLDDRTAGDRSLDALDHPIWNNRSNLVGWRSYVGDGVAGPDVPSYAAPARRADLGGLPPTWMYSSDIELFYAEDVAYADRLADAGVPVEFRTVSGAPHGFEALAPGSPQARELFAGARTWLRATLGPVARSDDARG